MKKTLLAFSIASIAAIGSVNAQTYYTENFNSVTSPALPTGYTSNPASLWITGAPNTVAPNGPAPTGLNTDLNDANHMMVLGINGAAAASNNAIISSPVFAIPAGATNAALLFDQCYFKVQLSADATKKEVVDFMVSTDGGANWTTAQADIAANNMSIWQAQSFPLGTYAGQSNLKVGFKYKNSGAALVGYLVDNMKVWMGSDVKMLSATVGGSVVNGIDYILTGTNANITGKFQNLGSSAVTPNGYYKATGAPVGPTAASNAAVLTSANMSVGTPYTVTAGLQTLKVWVTTPGDIDHTNDTVTISVYGVPSLPPKKVVFEEGTGTWCGWCPRGTVNMEEFASSHPGVAAQIAVHNGTKDPMKLAAYDSYLTTNYIDGFPSIVVDRTDVEDPGTISALYTSNMNKFGFAEFTMSTPTVTGTTVTATVTVKPVINIANPKLAFIITESNIQSPNGTTAADSAWYQVNYYAGGGQGTMGGWETKPAKVAGTVFHFVGRSITNAAGTTMPAGDAPAGWPATLVAGQTYTANITAPINSAWAVANLQYIAILNDGASGAILNSAFSTLPVLKPTFPTAIANVEAGISNAFIYPNPSIDNAFLQVDLKDATTGAIVIVDATGRTISTKETIKLNNGKNVIEIPTASLSTGLYFVNLNTAKGNITLKFQVVK